MGKKEEENKNQKGGTSRAVSYSFLHDERFHMIAGLLLFLVCIYFIIAFLSFFFTGGSDQSLVEHLDLKTSEEVKMQVQNWMGYRGACISNFFLAHTFGVSCFLPVGFLILLSANMMHCIKTNLLREFRISVFFLLWGSFFLSFLGVENSFFNFGGACGKSEVTWMESQIGFLGTFFFTVFILLLFCIYTYESTLPLLKKNSKVVAEKTHFDDILGKVGVHFNEGNNENESVPDVDSEKEEAVADKDESPSTEVPIEEKPSVEEESQPADPTEELEKTEETRLDDDFKVTIAKTEEVDTDDDVPQEVPDDDLPLQINAEATEEGDEHYDALAELGPYDPTLDLPDYQFPGIDLLKGYDADVAQLDEDELRTNKNRITQVLSNYGIEITSISATIGPTITLYEIVPAPGVRISKIKSLEDDIALSLAAAGIRIIAPIPGKGTVGIEVPNKNPQIVSMRSVINSKAFQECKYELPVAFGKTITNSVFMIDLAKMPHLLVAGATGQGKSVGLNALITSLLYKKHPSQLKIVMVDPKQVEFSIYEKIEKHYLAKLPGEGKAIITDTDKVVQTLTSLTTEMDNRYTLLKDANVRNIKEYNAKFVSRKLNPVKDVCNDLHHRFLPYIVVIIDEYGDLIMTAGKDIELPIARIAQKARAVGIHMVIATQRPSVKIITGTIKANFPARLAFRVASGTDSKTILDATGAQNLIGRGDFLFSQGGTDITRVQCAFVDTPEVQKINDFIGDQQGYPEAFRLPEYVDADGTVVGGSEVDTKSLDPKLKEAAELVVSSQNGSTSNIQRTLSLGFNRAGRIMDQLEAIGIVGPVNGSKPREVLVDNLDVLERIFDNLNK